MPYGIVACGGSGAGFMRSGSAYHRLVRRLNASVAGPASGHAQLRLSGLAALELADLDPVDAARRHDELDGRRALRRPRRQGADDGVEDVRAARREDLQRVGGGRAVARGEDEGEPVPDRDGVEEGHAGPADRGRDRAGVAEDLDVAGA